MIGRIVRNLVLRVYGLMLLYTVGVAFALNDVVLRHLFPRAAERDDTYYSFRIDNAEVIIPIFTPRNKDLPVIFVKSKTQDHAVKTARRLAEQLYGKPIGRYVIPFAGEEPSAVVLSPDLFSESAAGWRKYDYSTSSSYSNSPQGPATNKLRTLLYPLIDIKCRTIDEARREIQFVGWEGTKVQVRSSARKKRAATAISGLASYQLDVNLAESKPRTLELTLFKQNVAPKKIAESAVPMLYLINTPSFNRMNTELKKQYTRAYFNCQGILALDVDNEIAVIRRNKKYVVGSILALHSNAAPAKRFTIPDTAVTWPAGDAALNPDQYPGIMMQRVTKTFEEIENRGAYYITSLNGCRVLIMAPVTASREMADKKVIPAVFITGASKEQALSTANEIIHTIFLNYAEPEIFRFRNDPNSLVIISNPLFFGDRWENLIKTNNLTTAVVYPSMAVAALLSTKGQVDASHQYPVNQSFSRSENFNFIAWQGTILRVGWGKDRELLIDFTRKELDYLGIRVSAASTTQLRANSSKLNSMLLEAAAILHLTEERVRDELASASPEDIEALRRLIPCDEVYAYDGADFAIIRVADTYYLGSVEAIQEGLSKSREKTFAPPGSGTVYDPENQGGSASATQPLKREDLVKTIQGMRAAKLNCDMWSMESCNMTAVSVQKDVALILVQSEKDQADARRVAHNFVRSLPKASTQGYIVAPFAANAPGAAIFLPCVPALQTSPRHPLAFLMCDGNPDSYKDELQITNLNFTKATARITQVQNGAEFTVSVTLDLAEPILTYAELLPISEGGDIRNFLTAKPSRFAGVPQRNTSVDALGTDELIARYIIRPDANSSQTFYLVRRGGKFLLGVLSRLKANTGDTPAIDWPRFPPTSIRELSPADAMQRYLEFLRNCK